MYMSAVFASGERIFWRDLFSVVFATYFRYLFLLLIFATYFRYLLFAT